MQLLTINRFFLATITLSLTLFIFSCKKESVEKAGPAVSEAEAAEYSAESMETEASYDDIQDIGMTTADEEGILSAGRAEGLRPFPFLKLRVRIGAKAAITVTPDDNTYPKTVTVDFGDGYICPDLRFRKGKMVLHFTAPLRQPGSVVTISLIDYQVGRVKVEGTKVITNLSTDNNIKFSVAITGGKVTFPGGRGYTHERIKYITQVAGASTSEIADDVYSISGESRTIFKNGVVTTLKTVDDLIKKVSCAWISEGSLKMTIGSYELLLDYAYPANGECDNKALLKWNNKEAIILLP